MGGQLLLEGVERRGIDLLHVERAELRFDSLPEMLAGVSGAILHRGRCHVFGVAVREDDTPCTREEILPCAFLRELGFGSGPEPSLTLPSEAFDREVVCP